MILRLLRKVGDCLFVAHLMISMVVICLFLSSRASADPATGKTFSVTEGAFPWFDRTNWTLTQVPSDLNGNGPLAQQSCSSRSLTITGSPKSILVGVSAADVTAFLVNVATAHITTDKFAVKDVSGTLMQYDVIAVTNPPSTINGSGIYGAGLILLSNNAPTSSSVTPVPAVVGTVINLPKKKSFLIYVLMGQSNMVGRDTSKNDQQVDNPNILALNPEGKWVIAREPMHQGGTGIGPGISFAAAILAAHPKDTIGLVPCAVGGTPLSRWEKGGDLYERAIQRTALAVNDGVLSGVLWHQGESDSDSADLATTYQARLTQMFTDLRADLGSPNLPIVVGELGKFLIGLHPYSETIRAVQMNMPNLLPNVSFASSAGLVDKGDHLHFTADSQIEFGKRYAAAMLELQKKRQ